MVSIAIGGISSFTQAPGDTNSDISLESAIYIAPHEKVDLTGFFFWGNENARGAADGDLILAGGIVGLQATDNTSFVFEGYYANQANAGTVQSNSRWNGAALYAIHDINDRWGIRVRGEIFEDAGGARTCGAAVGLPNANVCFGATPAAAPAPVAQTLWETTFTLQYRPVPALMTRVEFRYDKSNKNTFQEGVSAANNQSTLAAEAIFLF